MEAIIRVLEKLTESVARLVNNMGELIEIVKKHEERISKLEKK